jgi:hypothetical protein
LNPATALSHPSPQDEEMDGEEMKKLIHKKSKTQLARKL